MISDQAKALSNRGKLSICRWCHLLNTKTKTLKARCSGCHSGGRELCEISGSSAVDEDVTPTHTLTEQQRTSPRLCPQPLFPPSTAVIGSSITRNVHFFQCHHVQKSKTNCQIYYSHSHTPLSVWICTLELMMFIVRSQSC